MTDPTFDTLEALEAWLKAYNDLLDGYLDYGFFSNADRLHAQIARVRAAHSHLKGNDDDAQ